MCVYIYIYICIHIITYYDHTTNKLVKHAPRAHVAFEFGFGARQSALALLRR